MNPPGNHQHHGNRVSTSSAKRFSASAAMVSESDLAEGFRFPVKKANPPGQFSDRPRPKGQSKGPEKRSEETQASVPNGPAPFRPADIGLTTSTAADMSTRLCNVTIPQSVHPQIVDSSPQERHNGMPQATSAATHVLESSLPGPVSLTMLREESSAGDKMGRAEAHPGRQLAQESRAASQPADQLNHHKTMKTPSQSFSTVRRSGRGSIPHREKGPVSVRHCGDLEGPPLCSPLKLIRTPQSRISKIKGPPRSRESSHRSMSPCERTSSQSSIVSTKPYIGKSGSGPDRQRLAMGQMVQHWNTCIQISNEEKAHAKREIGNLQSELLQQNEQLRECKGLLKERDSKLQELSVRYQELEKKQGYDAESKDHELTRLDNELKQSKAQVDIMQEKYRTYRDKLNEAIKEQQTLYTRTQTSHDDIKNEAQKMADERAADSQAFKNALRLSTKKRNELRHKINELRREVDNSEAESGYY
jgi:predicted  nucleic acid-binding Zn-ribbon protein